MIQNSPNYKKTILAIHIAVWLIVILSPLTFFDHGDKFSRDKLIPMISSPLMMMMVFYTMYLYVTPKYLFGENKRKFWIYTILLVLVAGIVLHLWMSFCHNALFKPEISHDFPHKHSRPFPKMRQSMEVWFLLRNADTHTFSC